MKRIFSKSYQKVKQAASMSKNIRSRISQELSQKGLDGNGRFLESDSGISIIGDVLDKYGYEFSNIVTKDLFLGDQGRRTLEIREKNKTEDPFMEGDLVDNTMVVYTWYKREEDNFEILSYIAN